MKAKDILDEIKAAEELTARGWRKHKCTKCEKGTVAHPLPMHARLCCPDCAGSGTIWIAPAAPDIQNDDHP